MNCESIIINLCEGMWAAVGWMVGLVPRLPRARQLGLDGPMQQAREMRRECEREREEALSFLVHHIVGMCCCAHQRILQIPVCVCVCV
jgi:hypothetical protein